MLTMFSKLFNKPTFSIQVASRPVSMLARLTPTQDSKNRVKRVGRGPGSGLGKTSGRGQKGQKARSSVPNWFEGGQTPLWKLFPKRGFYRHGKLELNELKLSMIENFYKSDKLNFLIKNDQPLTIKIMKDCGLITGSMKDGVVILKDMENYSVPIKIESTKASDPAIKAIESAGGSFTSVYYSRGLGYRAHHSPTWFIENKGHIPLPARPISRRDILFYSNPDKNGYLTNSEYVNNITVGGSKKEKVIKKTPLDLEVEKAKTDNAKIATATSFSNNRILSFNELNL
jgi:large subunit ribosomal protein L15